jgi:transposase
LRGGVVVESFPRSAVDLGDHVGDVRRGVLGEVGAFRKVLSQQWSGPQKLDTEIMCPSLEESILYSRSTLSRSDAVSAVGLFEEGFTSKSVALALDLPPNPVQMLYQRWQLRGVGALVTRDRRQYAFETKLEIVRRHVGGESGRALAEEYDLPSPTTVANWTVIYRRDGEDGLRPKRRGRPPTDRGDGPPEGELETLRKENEQLRAEVAYLGKLRALRSQERR